MRRPNTREGVLMPKVALVGMVILLAGMVGRDTAAGRWAVLAGVLILLTAVIFGGSCLLFMVQPMVARLALPLLGGTPERPRKGPKKRPLPLDLSKSSAVVRDPELQAHMDEVASASALSGKSNGERRVCVWSPESGP